MANQHVVGTGKRVVGDSGLGNSEAGFKQRAASQATRKYAHLSPSMSSSSTADNRTASAPRGTDSMCVSSHNDINRFTSGISMHHPYKDRGGAFDTTKEQYQGNPVKRTNFKTPTGSSRSNQTMRQIQKPKPYDDVMVENRMPSDPSRKGGNPSGPKGGTREVMNRMKSAGVNKMGRR